ncbi:winged helix-turn-helix transcriptional regulator [Sorangium sp. So ce513]|uniref:winged helix-turn-helix transcriptional regulator n=1 Tax=Sorangium sp. So ce513 TaxID=3133315 RepID=UPI003F649058
MKRSCQHLCEAFQAAMDVLAKPWNGLIIATLDEGALRFGEIGERIDAISDRMLSSRLKELEALGLVVRRVLPGPPVRVEYELTDAGRGFSEVAQAISRWGTVLVESAARGAAAKGGAAAAGGRGAAAKGGAAVGGPGRTMAVGGPGRTMVVGGLGSTTTVGGLGRTAAGARAARKPPKARRPRARTAQAG